MKKMIIAALAAVALLPFSVSAEPLQGAVFSPEQGIICDKKSGFCADSEGISLGFTKEYLGDVDKTSFTFAGFGAGSAIRSASPSAASRCCWEAGYFGPRVA